MRLACESVVPGLECTYVATGETAEEVHTAMMSHGAQRHSNLMDGMSEEERQTMGADMSGLIYELIAENN